MNTTRMWRAAACAAALATAEACMSSDKAAPIEGAGGSLDRDVSATQTVDQWEDLSARAARLLMNDYGVPDRVASDRLTWNNRGPWRRIVVRDEPPSDAAGKDLGLIEETVPYGALSPSQTADLARFDDRIAFDAAAGELSASSDDESLNILSLNLADDVVERRLNPEQARAAYFHDMELEQSGKTPRDMLSLRLTR